MKYSGEESSGKRWWQLNKGDVHLGVIDAAKSIDDHPNEIKRYNDYIRYRRCYDTQHWWGDPNGNSLLQQNPAELNWNLCAAVVDTAVSQIAGSPAQVMALTRAGDAEMQRRAKNLSMYFDGQFDRIGQADIRQSIARTMMICGTGVQMVVPSLDYTKPISRAVCPIDISVPVNEARWGHPTTVFHWDEIPKHVLMAYFPNKESIIERADRMREPYRCREALQYKGPDEMAYVLTAYRMPYGNKLGRHVMVTQDGCLIDEPWEGKRFPYVFTRWKPRDDDFWGIGAIQDIESIQYELDHLTWKVQAHMRVATTQVWTKKGSTVSKERAKSNLIFAHNTYVTEPPVVINQQPIDPAYFAERDKLFAKGFEIVGVSPMAATGQLPSGVEGGSGRAIRLFKDIAAGRIKPQQDRLDQGTVEVANLLVDAARIITERGDGDAEVMAKTKNGLISIAWKDVETPDEDYQVQYFPTSYLSQTPGGRLEDIGELLKIFPELGPYAMRAMDFPDLEAMMQLATAEETVILMQLEAITEHGIYVGPDAQTNPQKALPLALAAYHRAQMNQEDPDRLQMLRDYLAALNRLRQAAAPPPPPPGMPPPEAPGMPALPPMPGGPIG